MSASLSFILSPFYVVVCVVLVAPVITHVYYLHTSRAAANLSTYTITCSHTLFALQKGSTAFKNCKHVAILELFAAYGTSKNNNGSEGQDPVAPKLSGVRKYYCYCLFMMTTMRFVLCYVMTMLLITRCASFLFFLIAHTFTHIHKYIG